MDLHRPRQTHGVGVDVEPASVRSPLPLVFGGCGVVAGQGRGDEPVELGPRARPGHLRQPPVHLCGTRPGEGQGVLGDPPGPPHRHPTGQHPFPESREPVAQLERGADVGLPGVGGQPEGGGVLHHRELRDQRRTWSGDRESPVTDDPHRKTGVLSGRVLGVHGVADRPLDGEPQPVDLSTGDLVTLGAERGEEVGGVAGLFLEPGAGHGSTQAPATDSETLVVEGCAQGSGSRVGHNFLAQPPGLWLLVGSPGLATVGPRGASLLDQRGGPPSYLPTRPTSSGPPVVEVRAPASHETTSRGCRTVVEVRAPASHETHLSL